VIAAVILAAGAATRFGSPKQRLLLPAVLERARQSLALDDIVVVLGAYEVETDARTVHCPDWELGPGASLRCGLAALPPQAEAAVVILADGPNLNPASIERVVDCWRERDGDVLAATYDGARGHPLLAARRAWSNVPDEGLRGLAVVEVSCDDLGAPGDVDYPGDWAT
jgi:CTP:molybdopterin cytidylyltransferase MocA